MLRRSILPLWRVHRCAAQRTSSSRTDPEPKVDQAVASSSATSSRQQRSNEELQATRQRIRRMRMKDAARNAEAEPQEGETICADNEDGDFEERARELALHLKESTDNPERLPKMPALKEASEDSVARRDYLKKKLGVSQFRQIVYKEGELDKSDLSKPPSPENPHPFTGAHLPPTHARAIAPFVNTSEALRALVELGVDLFEVDTQHPRLGRHLVRLDLDRDVKPRLQWLVNELGFEPSDIGDYITRNPFFLIQNLDDMKTRVNYLEAKRFKKDELVKIVREFRFWLNVDVKTMDARLGWIQKQFQLSGNQVRAVIVKEPRVIMFGLGPLQRLVILFNKELKFTPVELKQMLLDDPRLYMMDAKFITNNYHYVHRVMGLPNDLIARHPLLLRCSLASIRSRHEFLKKVGRANYGVDRGPAPDVEATVVESSKSPASSSSSASISSSLVSYSNDAPIIPMDDFLHPSDKTFVSKAANSYLAVYNEFLRSH